MTKREANLVVGSFLAGMIFTILVVLIQLSTVLGGQYENLCRMWKEDCKERYM